MLAFVRNRWFLISLCVLITSGLAIGKGGSHEQVERLISLFDPPVTTVIVATVLFLMAFSLDNRQLRKSLRSPAPVVWATLLNYGLIPLLGWLLMSVQQLPDFRIGLMIAASVPCTMAAASVWTRKAGGNDAVSLLVTVLTNGTCFVITPLWLSVATSHAVQLDAGAMVARLMWAVLVPTVLGQSARLIPGLAEFATRHKTPLGVVAQACILILVFSAACKAGVQLNAVGSQAATLEGVLLVWGCCIAIHVVAMFVGVVGARQFGFTPADLRAVAFAGSQKTLPIGLLLATDAAMYGNPDLLGPGVGIPFAVFPMLMFHASQLFIDTAVADRMAAQADSPPEAATPER